MADEKGIDESAKKIGTVVDRIHQLWPKYVPYVGVCGYFTLAANALHLPVVQRVFTKEVGRAYTNGCFALSHFGAAVYIYHRPSFGLYPAKERLLYSLFGSTLFNLGSILSWSVLQVGLPKDEVGKSLTGLACGITYLYIGYRYLRSVDRYMLRAFKAGQKKLAEEESREVKDRLENSHLEYEDQEIELDMDDEVFSREGNLAEETLGVNVNNDMKGN